MLLLTPMDPRSELMSRQRSTPSVHYNGILMKRVVPADNSCLFTSIRFVLNGKIDNESSASMRNLIAQEVAADPFVYSDAVLGRSNTEYCSWIQRPDSWGGAIEVSILSNVYGLEIDVVDIQNGIIIRFGEDRNYELRAFILYDGYHYDPLYMEIVEGGAPATIFPVEEIRVYQQAEQLALEARSSRGHALVCPRRPSNDGGGPGPSTAREAAQDNGRRDFVEANKVVEHKSIVKRYPLKCMICGSMLIDELQSRKHARMTGHSSFEQI